jgi:hypothetical protein
MISFGHWISIWRFRTAFVFAERLRRERTDLRPGRMLPTLRYYVRSFRAVRQTNLDFN